MQPSNMNYSNKENDSLSPMGQGEYNVHDYGSMMGSSYFGTEPLDLQSTFGSLTLFPTNTLGMPQHQQDLSRQQFQQPANQFMSPNNPTMNPMHVTSVPIVKSQASLVKNDDPWSPPANYHQVPPTPLPTDFLQSWPSNDSNGYFQQEQDLPRHTQWNHASSSSPSYQDMMCADICLTPPPAPASSVPQYSPMMLQDDIRPPPIYTKKVNNGPRRSLPRRHTVSTVYNAPDHINNNIVTTGQQQQQQQQFQQQQYQQHQQQQAHYHHDANQQAKMRKMLKARRHRSLGRMEVPSHYLTKLDTAPYHKVSPSSSSCGASRCTSPLSAECLSNEQYMDGMMINMDTQTPLQLMHPPYANFSNGCNSDVPSSYTSFLAQPIYQTSPPSSMTTTSLSPPPSAVTATPETRHTLRHHHSHHQLLENDLYSMAGANHMCTNTAPSSPVLMSMIHDESDLDDLGHQGLQQEDDGPHTCQWADCRLEFQLLDHLIEHTKSLHIGSGKPLYYCRWKDCARGDKPFTKRHKMHNHLRTHTGERPFICMEEGCGKRFSRPDSLTTHSKIHTNIRPHVCQHENCDKAYYHLRSLRKHEKSHEVPPPLPTPTLLDQHLALLEKMMPKTPPLLFPPGLSFQFASHDTLEPLLTSTSSQGTPPSRSHHLASVIEETKGEDHPEYQTSSPFGGPLGLPTFKYHQQEKPFTSPGSFQKASKHFTNNGPPDESRSFGSPLPAAQCEHENDEKDGAAFDLEGTDHEISLLLGYIKEKLDKELQHIGQIDADAHKATQEIISYQEGLRIRHDQIRQQWLQIQSCSQDILTSINSPSQ